MFKDISLKSCSSNHLLSTLMRGLKCLMTMFQIKAVVTILKENAGQVFDQGFLPHNELHTDLDKIQYKLCCDRNRIKRTHPMQDCY